LLVLGRHVPRQIRTISARQQVGHCYQLAAECRQPVKLTVDLGDVVARQLFSVLAWRLPMSQNSSKRLDLPRAQPQPLSAVDVAGAAAGEAGRGPFGG